MTRFIIKTMLIVGFASMVGAVMAVPSLGPIRAEAFNGVTSSGGGAVMYFGTTTRTGDVARRLNTAALSPDAATGAGIRFVACYVNFTTGRLSTRTRSYFNWAGGVGCTATIILYGRAFLVESGHHYLQYGPYVGPGARRSYSSGGHILEPGDPSVYIFHGLNMRLLPSQVDDTIVGVFPQSGTRLSGASHCHQTDFTPNGPIGAHCDLYSIRF
jgi:hypothetical protein